MRIDPSPSLDAQVGLCRSPASRQSDTLPIVLVAPDADVHRGCVMDPPLWHRGPWTALIWRNDGLRSTGHELIGTQHFSQSMIDRSFTCRSGCAICALWV